MSILLVIFTFQFIPKVYHSMSLIRRMAKVTGYIFGTISLGFTLNIIAYLIASHVVGGCWYALAIQRVVLCLRKQCNEKNACNLALSCANDICYEFLSHEVTFGDRCAGNSTTNFNRTLCLDMDGSYNFGIYGMALPVVSSNARIFKILYTIAWGLFSLGTFGNDLEPTTNLFEVMFSICVVLSGLLLFILLIGNIQVFLEDAMQEKSKMELERRDMEWWMRRRQLPSHLKQRVRLYERQNWALLGGEDEMELIKDLPEGLRRDIKRFLCLELIRMVPLFHNLDDLILDNICDRVKPLLFIKNEKIIREGDLVQQMVFIVQGRIKTSQNLSEGVVATSTLGPGGYIGDELLSWCLRRPFINRLPTCCATFTCIEPTEAFGLDANHLHYVTDHFRYKFVDERLKRTVRYYSANWRTWAAVNIQLAWRRYVVRTRRAVNPVTEEQDEGSNRMLRQYAMIFMSFRPHDHL
ncbi:putative cyclic nucleotide-binding domain, rmlC-like jelly roll [Helianthus debilis subsp. tardiflorus]